MSNTTHLVFVYGSLKQGFGNYVLLAESEYNGAAVTLDPGYDLISLGGFPGVLRGENAVAGEIYTVDDNVFKDLDRLESNGRMYQREQVSVVDEFGDEHQAWMYIFLGKPWNDRAEQHDRVELQQTEAGFFVANWLQSEYERSLEDRC